MSIFAFTLSMPSNNSWDGKWSGEADLYCVTRTLRKPPEHLIDGGVFRHSFGDGWVAVVKVRVVASQEARRLRRKSKGFCGYGWMIDNIISHGSASGEDPA